MKDKLEVIETEFIERQDQLHREVDEHIDEEAEENQQKLLELEKRKEDELLEFE